MNSTDIKVNKLNRQVAGFNTQLSEITQQQTTNTANITTNTTNISNKVDKVTGKGLSTNDYDATAKAQVALIANKADTTYVTTQIQSVSSQVQGFYATVSALTTAFPTGNSNNYAVTGNVVEVDTLTVTGACTTAGNITVTLNGVAITVALTTAMNTSALVASAIAGTAFSGWTTSVNGSAVTFTKSTNGVCSTPVFSGGSTGSTATFAVTTAGVNTDNNIYRWNGSSWASTGYLFNSASIASNSVTRDMVQDDALSLYPFQPRSTFMHNKTTVKTAIRNAIKDVRLYNTDLSKNYCIKTLYKQATYWIIEIGEIQADGTTNTVVASFNVASYTYTSGIVKHYLTSLTSAGIYGYAYIDWSTMPTGDGYYNMGYNETGIIRRCLNTNVKTINTGIFENSVYLEANDVYNAIKSIKLYNADPTVKYYIKEVDRSVVVSSNTVHCIRIAKVSDSTVVCEYNALSSSTDETANYIRLVTVNSSGIYADINLDWSQLTAGTKYASYLTTLNATLSSTVYAVPPFKLVFPSKIYAVVNKEVNLYYYNAIIGNLNKYAIKRASGLGVPYRECLRINTSTTGTTSSSVQIYDVTNSDVSLYDTRTFSVVVADTSANSGITKKCMFIGDSLTDQGFYETELVNLFSSDVMKVQLLGTRGSGSTLHEGRSGWSSYDYLTQQTYNSLTNAFYNTTTSAFDFSYYITNNPSVGVPDWVFIQLGTNDVWRPMNGTTTAQNYATMIASIKAYNSNIKIGVVLTVPNADMENLQGNTQTNLSETWHKSTLTLIQGLMDTFGNRESEGLYLVPVYINLDTVNNMKTTTEAINSRNTTIVTRLTDAIHPATSGFNQIADSYYYFLKNQS